MAKLTKEGKDIRVTVAPEEFIAGNIDPNIGKGSYAIQSWVKLKLAGTKWEPELQKAKAIKIWFEDGQFQLRYMEEL